MKGWFDLDIEYIEKEVRNEVYKAFNMTNSLCNVLSGKEIAGHIEHTILNPDITKDIVIKACNEAKEYRFANVCVTPYYVGLAAEHLCNSEIAVCTVAGFPHGAATTVAKVAEIRETIVNGCGEIDVAMNNVAIKSGDLDVARKDLDEMLSASYGKAKIKAIYEQCLFNEEEKVKVLNIAKSCGVDFIKISNALSGKKATVEDVRFVRMVIGNNIGIKIDGGIRDIMIANDLLRAGANRLGCSASVALAKS